MTDDKERSKRDAHKDDHSSIFEKVVPEGFKRRIGEGMDSVLKDSRLKGLMGELKLPKEIVAHLLTQIDETKSAAVGVIAKETRLFLERTNIAEELAKVLTQVSLEVKTQVRFVPNDAKKKGGLKLEVSKPVISKIENDPDDADESAADE